MLRLVRLVSAYLKKHSSPMELEMKVINNKLALHEDCLYSELFWSVFSRIRTEYGEILRREMYYLAGEGAFSTGTFLSNSQYFLSIKFGKKIFFKWELTYLVAEVSLFQYERKCYLKIEKPRASGKVI